MVRSLDQIKVRWCPVAAWGGTIKGPERPSKGNSLQGLSQSLVLKKFGGEATREKYQMSLSLSL